MRHNKTTWLGIAALGVLQYMGPRPLFVCTAYAEAPVAFAVAADDLAPLAGLESADDDQTPAGILSPGSMPPNGN
jgi:hypothetical protein